MRYFIGIDPGSVSGAWCVLEEPGKVVLSGLFAPPITDLDILLRENYGAQDVGLAYLELVHAMPGQGVSSVFSFGASFGYWKGYLDAMNIPYGTVTPQKWQKRILDVVPGKRGVAQGESEKERERRRAENRKLGKEAIVQYAMRAAPELRESLSLKKNWGIADAYCLAKYAMLEG